QGRGWARGRVAVGPGGGAAAAPPARPRAPAAWGGAAPPGAARVAEAAGAPAAPPPAPARGPRLMPDPRRPFPLAPLAPPRVDDLVHDDDGDAEQRDDDDRFPERHRGLLS